jgi:hypothetical protein
MTGANASSRTIGLSYEKLTQKDNIFVPMGQLRMPHSALDSELPR